MPLQQLTLAQVRQNGHDQTHTTKIAHPPSTRYDEETPPSTPRKRRKIEATDESTSKTSSPRGRGTPRKARLSASLDVEEDGEIFRDTETSADTQIAAILPPVRTDDEAIEAYEAYKAQQEEESETQDRPTWIRGRSSIYVDAFNKALETVLEQEAYLFSEAEQAVFTRWHELSYSAQYLYVRLFLRKTSAWHRVSSLGYHSDIQDMVKTVEELQTEHVLPDHLEEQELFPGGEKSEQPLGHTFQFMESSREHIGTLDEASSLLLLEELKVLAKDAKVRGKNKQELLRNFRDTSGRQRGLTFQRNDTEDSHLSLEPELDSPEHEGDGSESGRSTPGPNRDEHYTKRILKTTGECVRLSLVPFQLFERVQLVYHRSTEWSPSSLTAIILAGIGRWNFPLYVVCRTSIFESRSMLLEYTASIRTQFRVDNAIEFSKMPPSRLVEFLKDMFETVYPRWKALLIAEGQKERTYDCGEGAYFRRFSPGWVYTRLVHKTLWALARMKEYVRERSILIELLDQRLFAAARRGSWYCRKALIEQRYYDVIDESDRNAQARKRHWLSVALSTCEAGLQDNDTHLIYHYDLQKRIKKLEKTLKLPRRQQHDFGHAGLLKAIDRTIEGVQICEEYTPDRNLRRADSGGFKRASTPTRRGGKTIWLDELDTNEHVSVEAFALSYYRKKHGYKGYHSEGSVLRCLFGLLFYDIMFSSYLPGSFQHAYQTAPLDLHTDAFYSARVFEINRRINELAEPGKARGIVLDIWETHRERKTMIIGVRWDDYELEDLLELCDCFTDDGSGKLGVVMRLLAEDYGARGGGVPDLCLWLPAPDGAGKVMFVEVKSENDRLSDTQRLWISVLLNAGIEVEVCHVLAKEVRE